MGGRRLVYETIRRMINEIVVDVIEASSRRLAEAQPAGIDDVRRHDAVLIQMSEGVRVASQELKAFLRENLYRHYRVQRMTRKARLVVQDLFRVFMEDLVLMPDEHRQTALAMQASLGTSGRARAVADYIAGMTDRYAISEHERIFVPAKRS
jgi:dGTPase